MRILTLSSARALPAGHRRHVKTCAACGAKYPLGMGILAKLEHEVGESQFLRDEHDLKRRVGLYAYHNLACFTAVIDASGHA